MIAPHHEGTYSLSQHARDKALRMGQRLILIDGGHGNIAQVSTIGLLKRQLPSSAVSFPQHGRGIAQRARAVACAGTVGCGTVPRQPKDPNIHLRPLRVIGR